MVYTNKISESLVANLLKETEFIKNRTKIIQNTLTRTQNNNLRIRLKSEYLALLNKLENIQTISIDIFKSTRNEISLSALLIEKGKRVKEESHNNIELFFP